MRGWWRSLVAFTIVATVVFTACERDQASSTQSPTSEVAVGRTMLTLESTALSQTTAGSALTTTTAFVPATVPAPTTTTTLQEPVTLKLASPFDEAEPGGLVVQQFMDRVGHETGGAIRFDLYPGGILGDPDEIVGLLERGGVDVALLSWEAATRALPLLGFPGFPPGGQSEALAYCNHLVFENSETSALIQREGQAHRLWYLGFLGMGANSFFSRMPIGSLAQLKDKNCASSELVSPFEALGAKPVQSLPTDVYAKLSTGSVDCAYGRFLSAVHLKWPEVAPFVLFDGTHVVGALWSVNTKAWSKLRPETQMVLVRAVQDLETWGSQLVLEDERRALANLGAAGVTVRTLASEEQSLWWNVVFKAQADAFYELARSGGFAKDALTILEQAARFSGADWSAPSK